MSFAPLFVEVLSNNGLKGLKKMKHSEKNEEIMNTLSCKGLIAGILRDSGTTLLTGVLLS